MTTASVLAPALRAVDLCRVSVDNERSPVEQHDDNMRTIDRHGWQHVGTYVENGASASPWRKKERSGDFDRFKADLLARRFDVAVVWESSRLTRDVEVHSHLMRLLRENDVRLCSGDRVYNLADPKDAFFCGMSGLTDQLASAETRERVLRAVTAAAAVGKPHGKRQFGYQREYDPTTGKLIGQVEHPTEGAIVREMFARAARGDALMAIARWVNEQGVTRRHAGDVHKNGLGTLVACQSDWTGSLVGGVLRSRQYLGHRYHKGEVTVRDAWPALVDDVTYRRVQMSLADPKRRTTTRQGTVVHLLSGLIICDVCDEAARFKLLGGGKAGPRDKPGYRCRRGCSSRYAEPLETAITHLVLKRLTGRKRDVLDALAGGDDHELDTVVAELARDTQRLADITEALSDTDEPVAALVASAKKLEASIDQLTRRADALRAPLPAEVVGVAGGDAFARWHAASHTLGEKRAIIRALLDVRIVRHGGGELRVVARFKRNGVGVGKFLPL